MSEPIEHYQLYVHGDVDGAVLAQLLESLAAQDADWKLTYYVDGRPVHIDEHKRKVQFVLARKAPHNTVLEMMKRLKVGSDGND